MGISVGYRRSLLAVAVFSTVSCQRLSEEKIYVIKVGEKAAYVELATTPGERERGLMFRDRLLADHGMLFVFPEEQMLAFWMKNTKIPLSVAYLTASGVIVQIESMAPNTLSLHPSRTEVKYALEMGDGWFDRSGIKVGDTVTIPAEVSGVQRKIH